MTNLLPIFLLFIGCSTINPVLVEKTYLKMDVFYPGEEIPEKYNIIGDIFVAPYDESPDGTLDCSYDSVLNRAAEKTKELGGNAFKITNLKTPSVNNPCYRVSALALISNE